MDRTAQLSARPAQPGTACGPPLSGTSLHRRAARVLDANWTGRSTVPSRSLYPHQWSWDSAFIAIGLRHVSPLRAQTELETLLAAQWADGRVPHIVFNPSVPLGAYFPGPDFWRSGTAGRGAGAPRTVQTSGIVQPPVHALAAWLVHQADPGLSRARGFLARVHPRLAAWHRYLLHRRDLGGGGLVSVVHPWEQGMDNSPCWDAPLARVTPAPAHSFRRADLDHGAAAGRPTDLDYGRYVRLAADYRDAGYADEPGGAAASAGGTAASAGVADRTAAGADGTAASAGVADGTAAGADGTAAGTALPDGTAAGRTAAVAADGTADPAAAGGAAGTAVAGRVTAGRAAAGTVAAGRTSAGGGGGPRTCAFAVEDPAFNALLIASEHALARIAEELGASGTARRARAARLTTALVERLWEPAAGIFLCRDLHGEGLIGERGVGGLVPLLLPDLPPDIAAALVRTVQGPHFSVGDRALLVPSYDLLGEAFDPHRYWRGPAWFNTAWLLERGLRTHGERERADALREAVLDLAGGTGFAEYVDPCTGEACGAAGFSWTAALALDLLHRRPAPRERQTLDKSPQKGVSRTGTGTFGRSDEGGDRG
ncbi:hypothetical protein [Streptomyces sp. NPDC096012]|uniref:MGH1-like glycoside hydrolase domain-containing protein n=1 Tax=Streptomyces sp. NPDC096012 TaxID=3155684 RepID=UPI003369CB7B